MIWCVEDDGSIRDIEVYALQSAGLAARGFADGSSFWEAVQRERPDLVVLDIMLPGVDGVELLRRIRERPELSAIPVVMATAKGAEYDKVQSLDLGADYYLTKPFGVMEFLACVRSVLRRCGAALTYKEFELLRLFLSHPGVAFTREQLMSEIWGTDYCGESRTVDMHIRTLRGKLGPYGDRIETVRGVGYRLEGKP